MVPECTGVEGVGSVPSLRPELSPLRDACVEVTQREQEGLEFGLFGAHLERLLREVVERFVEVGLHAPRRLVGDLNGGLQDTLWQVTKKLRISSDKPITDVFLLYMTERKII